MSYNCYRRRSTTRRITIYYDDDIKLASITCTCKLTALACGQIIVSATSRSGLRVLPTNCHMQPHLTACCNELRQCRVRSLHTSLIKLSVFASSMTGILAAVMFHCSASGPFYFVGISRVLTKYLTSSRSPKSFPDRVRFTFASGMFETGPYGWADLV